MLNHMNYKITAFFLFPYNMRKKTVEYRYDTVRNNSWWWWS